MKQVQYIKKLESLSYFDTETVSQLTDLGGNSLYKNLSRQFRNNNITKLKRGFYTTNNYILNLKDRKLYVEFIANKLFYPSYLSLEYVLSKYQILSESVFAYTSISQKTTRTFSNKLGTFFYKNIADRLFLGYTIISRDGYEFAQATKSKALFDYLYLKFFRKNDITKENIDDLRLNLDSFSKVEIKEFEKYCTLTNIKKYLKLPRLLFHK